MFCFVVQLQTWSLWCSVTLSSYKHGLDNVLFCCPVYCLDNVLFCRPVTNMVLMVFCYVVQLQTWSWWPVSSDPWRGSNEADEWCYDGSVKGHISYYWPGDVDCSCRYTLSYDWQNKSSIFFLLWGGTCSLCMPALRPASQAGPMCNPMIWLVQCSTTPSS